jgi:hypothetical protein
MALVLTISVTKLPDVSRQQRLCRETRRVQLLFDRARARSLAFGAAHTVSLRTGALELRNSAGVSLEKLPLHPEISVKTTSNIQGEVSFYPTHTATPGTLTISLDSLAATLVVSLRGRTRVQC